MGLTAPAMLAKTSRAFVIALAWSFDLFAIVLGLLELFFNEAVKRQVAMNFQ